LNADHGQENQNQIKDAQSQAARAAGARREAEEGGGEKAREGNSLHEEVAQEVDQEKTRDPDRRCQENQTQGCQACA
jgi:hypothetical protein